MFAVTQSTQHQLAREAGAADGLHDNVERRIVDQGKRVVADLNRIARDSPSPCDITHRDPGNFNAAAGAPANFFLIAVQYFEGTATHRAESQQTYFDWFHTLFKKNWAS